MNKLKSTFLEKFGYGLGDTASNLFFMTFIYFLTYFYTDVFGISAAAAGTMFALTRIWDGINDPLMGVIADRTHTRWGKFRPYILWMVLPFGIIGILTFTTPNLGASGKIVYAYITYTLMMMIYTAINIPYSSLMGVVSSNPHERTRFSQYRFILAFAGGLIVQGATLPLVSYFGGGDTSVISVSVQQAQTVVIKEQGPGTSKLMVEAVASDGTVLQKDQTVWVNTPEIIAEADTTTGILFLQEGFGEKEMALSTFFPGLENPAAYTWRTSVVNEQNGFQFTMTAFAVLAVLMFLITFWVTKERVQPPVKQKTSLKNDFGDLVKNVPWVILFFLGIFTLTYVCIRNGSIIYYFKYYVGDKDLATSFMLTGTFATIAAIMVMGWFSKKFGKKNTYIGCMALTTLFTVAYYFVGKDQIVLIYVLQVLANFTFGPTAPLVFAMYTDTADYSEWKTGRRATGLVMSASTMAQKFGWAIGGALTGWLLAAFGFVANVEQSLETMDGIKVLFSVVPALSSLVGIFLMMAYKLDEKTMAEIETDLLARRAEK